MTASTSLRSLDHLVLPTGSLPVARDRLGRLGFTVAPDGIHPFGTANCCVYFADGTFMEPLAVTDERLAEAACAAGNAFLLRDRVFRARRGEEGLCAVVFASQDADADHAEFTAMGVSGGARLDFSRAFVDASGKQDTASFRLAFAADTDAKDCFFFSCERVNAPAVDRGALQAHGNTVTRLKAILADAPEPAAAASFVSRLVRGTPVPSGTEYEVALANAAMRISRRSGADGLALTGVVFGVADLDALTTLLSRNAVPFYTQDGGIRIDAAPGQGVPFLFEAE